eukprot:364569-Chlamydomonas_euryale.AAC.29
MAEVSVRGPVASPSMEQALPWGGQAGRAQGCEPAGTYQADTMRRQPQGPTRLSVCVCMWGCCITCSSASASRVASKPSKASTPAQAAPPSIPHSCSTTLLPSKSRVQVCVPACYFSLTRLAMPERASRLRKPGQRAPPSCHAALVASRVSFWHSSKCAEGMLLCRADMTTQKM